MWRHVALLAVLGCGSSTKTPTTATATVPAGEPGRASSAPPVTSRTSLPSPDRPGGGEPARAQGRGNRCDTLPTSELSIDGLLDDWSDTRVVARIGSPADGAIEMHCAWDGTTLAFAFDLKDDRIVRVKGGREDKVTLELSAGGKPVSIVVFPGNQLAKAKISKPGSVEAADSLQPKGFSVEIAIPAAAVAGYSPSLPAFQLEAVFHDSDAATGGDTTPLAITQPIELPDRKDLLDDFLATVRLRKADITLDTLAELDPDRKGKERLVAGGTVIGVLTEQYAYVTLPAASGADIKKLELLALGPKGQQVISALVRQSGNGGARELLMLWTVWSGQLQPLVNIEIKKELGGNVLESTYKLVKGKRGPELIVEAKPAIGFTPETWNEVPAGDSDSIVLPWDEAKTGIAYTLKGAEIERRDLPRKKKKK